MTQPAASDKGPVVPLRYACFFPQGPFWVGEPVDVISDTWSKTLMEVVAAREHSTFSLSITKDGQVALRLKGQEEPEPAAAGEAEIDRNALRWGLHLAYLNAFIVLLATFAIDVPVSIREVTWGEAFVENRVAGVYTGSALPNWGWSRRMLDARHHFVCVDSKLSEDPALRRWRLRVEVVEYAFDAIETLAAQEGAIFQVAGLNKAVTEYAIGNFSIAVVLAWFVIERELTRRWEEALADHDEVMDESTGERRVNAERRKVLNGREFTAHIKSQMLELLSSLSHEQFKKVDECRGFRNKAVHRGGEGLGHVEAGKVIRTAGELVSETYGVPLTLPLAFGFTLL